VGIGAAVLHLGIVGSEFWRRDAGQRHDPPILPVLVQCGDVLNVFAAGYLEDGAQLKKKLGNTRPLQARP
jgi:hypothetical protein